MTLLCWFWIVKWTFSHHDRTSRVIHGEGIILFFSFFIPCSLDGIMGFFETFRHFFSIFKRSSGMSLARFDAFFLDFYRKKGIFWPLASIFIGFLNIKTFFHLSRDKNYVSLPKKTTNYLPTSNSWFLLSKMICWGAIIWLKISISEVIYRPSQKKWVKFWLKPPKFLRHLSAFWVENTSKRWPLNTKINS